MLLAKLSPYSLDAPELIEKERDLARLAGSIESSLHPATAGALADAMSGINAYYSNLIEGPSTHPINVELAAAGRPPLREPGETPEASSGKYLKQALAGIAAALEMRRALATNPELPVESERFIRGLHYSFTSRLPDELRVVRDSEGKIDVVVPGEFRKRHVAVGDHVAPDPGDIPGLMEAFAEMYRLGGRTVRTALLMHHRLAWIHPFLDGNGRAARQLTDAMLIRAGMPGAGLWSLSRGLAWRRDDYLRALSAADTERKGDYDGRGERSRTESEKFVRFMLDVALDQVRFMAERLNTDHLLDRLRRFCDERHTVLGRDRRAYDLLKEALLAGPCERGRAGEILNLGTRRTSDLIKELLHDKLLTSKSERGAVHVAFPAYSLAYLFPHLFLVDDPQAAMKAFCADGQPALLATEVADKLMPTHEEDDIHFG